MPSYILRLEGVDFGATIEDTHNLSAYRGGSLALLAAPRAAEIFLKGQAAALGIGFDVTGWDENDVKSAPPARIFAAASQGAWRIEAKDDAAADHARDEVERFLRETGRDPRSGKPPFAYCSFDVDAVRGDDLAALKQAEANGHERQLRFANWEPPRFDPEARGGSVGWDEEEKKWKPVHLDPMRPATFERHVKKQKVKVSPSFAARFKDGLRARQRIYRIEADEAKTRGLYFTDSFEEIIGDWPDGLPKSLRQKIAVFYADGNKFTRIREKSGTIANYSEFSSYVLTKQRDLMGEILTWLKEGAEHSKKAFVFTDPDENDPDDRDKARFETLLWGGDELTFVMPAWLGIEFARKFCENWTKDWDWSGNPLTFGIGLVFCHEKTPIRQARKMAKIMAEDAKKTLGGKLEYVLQIEAFESIALPEYEGGLERYRAKLFDLGDSFDKEKLARTLTLRGGAITNAFDKIAELKKDGGFPRSQIYNLLRTAKKQNGGFHLDGASGEADTALIAQAKKYLGRMKRDEEEGVTSLRILGEAVPLAYSLAVISGLWDYVEPLALVPPKDAVGQKP